MPELFLHRVGDMLETRFGEYHASTLWSNITSLQLTPQNVRTYGHDLFDNVTQDAELHSALANVPEDERIVLLTEGEGVAAIPWEYMRLPEGVLLASRNIFVRGVPEAHRKTPFTPTNPVTIVAVPVSPVDEERVLNTEGEWRDLARMVRKQGYSLKLTRTRPPTLATMKSSLSRKGTNIVQFMGHSGVVNGQGRLLFEDDLGNTKYVDVPTFKNFLNVQTFLVVLNSCQSAVTTSAAPDKYRLMTPLSNMAESLVQRAIPYALGMQFSLPDDAALEITTRFYEALLQGSNVEEAVRDMRAALEQSNKLFHEATAYSDEINAQWLAGLPVLYTNQREAAPALDLDTGQPTIQPDIEQLSKTCNLNALPTPAHFVGRGDYISEALKRLLNPSTEGFVVLHGLGGIGKTALSRVIAERVSYSFDDHVFAYSFETFTRFDSEGKEIVNEQFAATFYSTLASYYGLDPRQFPDERTLKDAIITQRKNIRSLLVLDNIETLIEAQKRDNEGAKQLASFVSRLIEDKNVVMLTSRDTPPSDWGHTTIIELSGLDNFNGAKLFLTSIANDRRDAANVADCIALTQYVKGHPLSIRLLAGRFSDDSAKNLHDFLTNVQNELASARQKTPRGDDPNRHATLSECLEYSIRRLTDEQKKVLYTVGIFLAPFLEGWAEYVLDDKEQTRKFLQDLERLGLLESSKKDFEEGYVILYEMHPMLRQHIKAKVDKLDKEKWERHGFVYTSLASQAWQAQNSFDRSTLIRYLFTQSVPDCEVALKEDKLSLTNKSLLSYNLAKLYERRGQTQQALALYLKSLEIDQELGDKHGTAVTQHTIANLLILQGKIAEALKLYEKSLLTKQGIKAIDGIAAIQTEIAKLLVRQGKVEEAMGLYNQTLTVARKLEDKGGIAITQHAIANLLAQQGKVEEAIELYQQLLITAREQGEVGEVVALQVAIANLLKQQGKVTEAHHFYEQSLKAYYDMGDVRNIALVQGAIGDLLIQQRKLAEAMPFYEQSLLIMKRLGEVREVAVTQHMMANILAQQGKVVEATELYQQSLASTQKLNDVRGVAAIQFSMAQLLNKQGQVADAMKLYQQSLKVYQYISDIRNIANVQHEIANILVEQEKMKEAKELYEASLLIKRKLGDLQGVAVTLVSYSQLLWLQGEQENSLKFAWQALSILSENEYPLDTQDIRTILAQIKSQFAGDEQQFDTLWKQATSTSQPDWLRNIQVNLSNKDEFLANLNEETRSVVESIAMFINEPNWDIKQHIVEEKCTILFQKETERVFETWIEQAKVNKDQNMKPLEESLEKHFAILRDCKTNGIAQAFKRIRDVQAHKNVEDNKEESS